jgi:membrane fusion protein, multidrug efflux system
MKRSVRLLVLVSVLCCSFAASCSKPAPAPPGKKGNKALAFPVEVLRVEERAQDLEVTAPGVVEAFERIQVTARVSGGVDRVTFAEGQEVKKGQVLANIDSRRFALAVSSARASVAKAQATLADSEQNLKRRENASANSPGLIPGEELETYKMRLQTAKADVDAAGEALKLAQLNLEDSSVKAQAEGVIQTRSVETGQYVQAGTIIATLLRRDPMLLRFNVTTTEAPRLKVGMTVEFTLKESQRTYTATITLISASADADSRLVAVTAQVATDHKFWLRPGSFAQVKAKLPSARAFAMIPQTGARPSDRGFLAYVVEGDVARERIVTLGMHTSDGWVEVRDGLKGGELLVTRGMEALADGLKVQIGPAGGASARPETLAVPSAGAPPSAGEASAPKRRGAKPGSSAGASGEAP